MVYKTIENYIFIEESIFEKKRKSEKMGKSQIIAFEKYYFSLFAYKRITATTIQQ